VRFGILSQVFSIDQGGPWRQIGRLRDEFQAFEVGFRPASLVDHALQRLPPESAAAPMKHNGHSAPRRDGNRSGGSRRRGHKQIHRESRDAGGEIPEQAVVEAYESGGNGHARIDGDFHLVGRFLRQSFAVLNHGLHNHADKAVDVRLRLGSSPG